MKYTVINRDTGAPAIQQTYDVFADALARCDALVDKTAGHYPFVVAYVDDAGNLHESPEENDTEHEPIEEGEEEEEENERPKINRRGNRPSKRGPR